jgi:hypothetical protein
MNLKGVAFDASDGAEGITEFELPSLSLAANR